jgi:hypothetical protein
MIVSIHQPQYMPYIGYIYKILKSDVFVFLDDAQYKKNEWQNRNRIKGPNGLVWITVPVSFNFGDKINEVKIVEDGWQKKHLNSIKSAYSKSNYFKDFFPYIENLLSKKYENLSVLNIKCVEMILDYLGVKKEIVISSTLNIDKTKTERLVEIVKKLNGDTYLSGDGAYSYLDEEIFEESRINLLYLNYKPVRYNQLWGDFIENLSVIDLIFNEGRENTLRILIYDKTL